jgi:hypothetical protein
VAEPSLTLDDMRRLRAGTSLGFTVYAQFGEQPTKSDPYLGVFNNSQLAAYAVEAVNNRRVSADMPWVAIGRLIYPGPGVDRLDDFIAVMASASIARWLANAVADLTPEGTTRHG